MRLLSRPAAAAPPTAQFGARFLLAFVFATIPAVRTSMQQLFATSSE